MLDPLSIALLRFKCLPYVATETCQLSWAERDSNNNTGCGVHVLLKLFFFSQIDTNVDQLGLNSILELCYTYPETADVDRSVELYYSSNDLDNLI